MERFTMSRIKLCAQCSLISVTAAIDLSVSACTMRESAGASKEVFSGSFRLFWTSLSIPSSDTKRAADIGP